MSMYVYWKHKVQGDTITFFSGLKMSMPHSIELLLIWESKMSPGFILELPDSSGLVYTGTVYLLRLYTCEISSRADSKPSGQS